MGSNDWCPYKRKDRKTQGKDDCRDWGDAATSQGHLGPPEAGRSRKHPPLEPPEHKVLQHLDFILRASKTLSEYISVA